jgi:hypothetical protein
MRHSRDGRYHKPGTGSRKGHQCAHRRLGIRVPSVRDAHQPAGVPGRNGFGHTGRGSACGAGVEHPPGRGSGARQFFEMCVTCNQRERMLAGYSCDPISFSGTGRRYTNTKWRYFSMLHGKEN